MNRPFGALGTLAAMLALAMMAVSSTSRSTTVGPGPASRHRANRVPARGGYLTASEQKCAQPAASATTPPAACSSACDQTESSDGECDEALATNRNHWSCEFAATCAAGPAQASRVPTDPPPGDPLAALPSSSNVADGLKSAQLEAVEPLKSLPTILQDIDCRAVYDPEYDELIHGAQCVGQRSDAAAPASEGTAGLDSGEVIELFQSIFRSSTPEINVHTSQRRMPFQASTSIPTWPLSWSEYSELIDEAVVAADLYPRPRAPLAELEFVRSSRGALHSAAAMVNDLTQLLTWAAEKIDSASLRTAIATATGALRKAN